MLTNLLPGLRELRPPLAAGGLWLVTFFVAGRALAKGETTIPRLEPAWDAFSALSTAIDDTWGTGIVIGFAAFLIGGLSHAFVTDSLLSRSRTLSAKGARSIELVARQSVGGLVDELDLQRLTRLRVSAVDPVLEEAFREFREPRDQREGIMARGGDEDEAEFVLTPTEAESLERIDWRSPVRSHLESGVPAAIMSELPSVATRLIGEEQALFDQYDRLRAEAEFRIGLVPPLAVLSFAIGFLVLPWEAVWAAAAALVVAPAAVRIFDDVVIMVDWRDVLGAGGVVAIVLALGAAPTLSRVEDPWTEILTAMGVITPLLGVTCAIFAQGLKVHRTAGDLLADAIFVGRVESPLLERLNRSAGVLPGGDDPSRKADEEPG